MFDKGKCKFNKQSWVYCEMKFSEDGASPDPRKVDSAIKAAEPPCNGKELNSFLCTVQYNARFMEKYAPQTNLEGFTQSQSFYLKERTSRSF